MSSQDQIRIYYIIGVPSLRKCMTSITSGPPYQGWMRLRIGPQTEVQFCVAQRGYEDGWDVCAVLLLRLFMQSSSRHPCKGHQAVQITHSSTQTWTGKACLSPTTSLLHGTAIFSQGRTPGRAHGAWYRPGMYGICTLSLQVLALENSASSTPDFVPQEIDEIKEEEGLRLASSMQRCRIDVPSIGPVDTAFTEHGSRHPNRPPIVLLHGFDGSLLEFRRLVLELEAASMHNFAVDLAGWGFTCSRLFNAQPDLQLGPQQKSDHLYEFWKSKVCLFI